MLRYHLLWELTHVCFEHPGLLAPVDDVCGDEVVHHLLRRGQLAEVVDGRRTASAVVRARRGVRRPSTRLLVGPVVPGDLVLVHAGTAIARVDCAGPER